MTPNLLPASLPFDPSRIPVLLRLLEQEQSKRIAQNRLRGYRPYTKQKEFHAAGATHHERLFMAGNQLGKTWAGGFETAMHLTGRYPDWWQGATFDKAPIIWASGVTSESTRDNPQRVLIGNPPIE
jgi:Terminase large subunit, T4likevirus-type, N-terminal